MSLKLEVKICVKVVNFDRSTFFFVDTYLRAAEKTWFEKIGSVNLEKNM